MHQKLVLRQKLKPLLIVGFSIGAIAITVGLTFFLNIGNVRDSFGKSKSAVWTGYENGKWNNPNNWSDKELPSDGDEVIISESQHTPVFNGKLKLGGLTLDKEAILRFSGQVRIDGDLVVEPSASFLVEAGLCQVDGNVIVRNGLVRLSGGMLKCSGRLADFGGQVSLHSEASLQVNHDFELQGENAQFNVYGGDVEIKGDLDFITDEKGGKTSVFLESGALTVENALRFYRVDKSIPSSGSLTINGGELRAASIERQGQNIDFEKADAHISMTSGILHFTSTVAFEQSDHIDLKGGSIQFDDDLTSSKPLVTKASFVFENKSSSKINSPFTIENLELRDRATLEISADLKVDGEIISNSSKGISGNGKLLFVEHADHSISGSRPFMVSHLVVALNQDVLVSNDIVVTEQLDLKGRLLRSDTESKLELAGDAKFIGHAGGFACLPVVQSVASSTVFPLGSGNNPYFLTLQSDNDPEYVEVAVEQIADNLTMDKDLSIVDFELPIAWKIQRQDDDGLTVKLNSNTESHLLAGLTDEGWTALVCETSEQLNEYSLPIDCEYVTLCLKPKMPEQLVTVSAEMMEDGVKLDWALDDKSAVKYYSIKRKQGNKFIEIARIPVGSSSQYFDPEALGESLTYRIDLVNEQGYFLKGKPVVVQMKPTNESENMRVAAYPNPFSNELNIKVVVPESELATISVLDAGGKIHWTGSNFLADGANTIPINELSSLQSGNYRVHVSTISHSANVAVQKAN